MQDYTNPYASPYSVAAQEQDVRAEFIRKTYLHLAGAIGAFALLEWIFFQIPAMVSLGITMASSGAGWLIVLAAFMGVSYLANKWAHSNTSKQTQYLGLGLYVLAEAIIFLPLLLIASMYSQMVGGTNLIFSAAIITVAMTLGLTVIVFTTKKDFSFLGGILKVGGLIAIGVIVASIIVGFSLGIIFSAIMVAFAAASILYNTSNIIHHYNTNQYVAASLGLFASVALLFWYILQVLMSLASSD